MKSYFLLFIALLFLPPLSAQTEIKGKVVSAKSRKPVSGATVTLHPVGTQNVLTYGMTNEDGTFVLKKSGLPDTVVVAVRSMNTEKFSKKIRSNIGFVTLEVNEKANELKEVIVKAPKIRQLGDTINYSVSSFIDATDKSIGDVLKKLPGIQVLSSGQILYQNKAISKFYIEGLDMLKGKYGIATNNIDASKVATVQVLENHQPIKALKDMEIPEEAAINLKLRDSAKGAFFVNAQLGTGLPLLLLNNEAVGMRFTRKQQNMLVYKNDNTGRDIAQELFSFYDEIKNQGQQFLSVSQPGEPSIKEQHYLLNAANMVSLNNLFVIKKEVTLTGNLNFIHDQQTRNGFSQREIFLPNTQKVSIIEDTQGRLLKRELEGNLIWEGNADSSYINNKLRGVIKWNAENSELLPRSSSRSFQSMKLPEVNISNDFEYLIKRAKRQYRMGSFVGFVSQPTSLTVQPSSLSSTLLQGSQADSIMLQEVNYRHWVANAFLAGGTSFRKWSVWYRASLFANLYRLQSDLYNDFDRLKPFAADSLQNRFSRNELGAIASLSFHYKISPKLQPMLSIPLRYMQVERSDAHHGLKSNKGYLLFSPYFSLNYPVSPRVTLFLRADHTNSIGGMQEDYLGYIMTNYRSLNRSGRTESKYRTTSGNVSLNYKNPFTTLFANFYLMFNNNWTNILRDVRYDGIFTTETGIDYPNTSSSYSAGFSMGQNIDALRTDLSFRSSYSISDGLTLNQGDVANIHTESLSMGTSITTDVTRWMIVKYSGTYRQSSYRMGEEKMPKIHTFRQDITASLIPVKKMVLSMSFNNYYNSALSNASQSVWFGNAGVKYKMKRADIMLDCTNIFNTRQFVNTSYSSISSFYSVSYLRPMEVLMRVRFKLL